VRKERQKPTTASPFEESGGKCHTSRTFGSDSLQEAISFYRSDSDRFHESDPFSLKATLRHDIKQRGVQMAWL
jgi:hypothetical protein